MEKILQRVSISEQSDNSFKVQISENWSSNISKEIPINVQNDFDIYGFLIKHIAEDSEEDINYKITEVYFQINWGPSITSIFSIFWELFTIGTLSIRIWKPIKDIYIDTDNRVWLTKLSLHGNVDNLRLENCADIILNWFRSSCKNFHFNNQNNQSIEIKQANFQNLVIWDTIIDKDAKNITVKSLKIENSIIDKIQLKWFSQSRVTFQDFKIIESSIKWGFIGYLNFDSFPLLESRITDSYISEVNFPQNSTHFLVQDSLIEKNIFSNLNWGKFFKESSCTFGGLKESYRMIKYQYESIWNKTEANKFFAKEMEYHMKTLEKDPKKKWEYYVALLQKEVSDFGNDWMRAFGWYLAVCIVWFSISILLSIGFWAFFGCSLDLGDGLERWQRFVAYLNPIPKFEEAKSLWYLIISIIKGILVYQIIVSLKRISQR